MKVLVINSGSSSIKYELFDMTTRMPLASGLLEQIGEPEGWLRQRVRGVGYRMNETIRKGSGCILRK